MGAIGSAGPEDIALSRGEAIQRSGNEGIEELSGELGPVVGKIFGHNQLRSYCLQVQSVIC